MLEVEKQRDPGVRRDDDRARQLSAPRTRKTREDSAA